MFYYEEQHGQQKKKKDNSKPSNSLCCPSLLRSSLEVFIRPFIILNSILIIISDRGKSNIKGDRGGMETLYL
jgi:hypothetical protein